MTYLKFDDSKVKKAFRNIANNCSPNRKIDNDYEKQLLSTFLSNNKDQLTKFDIALLKSGTTRFEDKNIKKAYKKIAEGNNNHKLDTPEEIKTAKNFLEKNKNNMSISDIKLFSNLIEAGDTTAGDIFIKIDGDNNNVIVVKGKDNRIETRTVTSPVEQQEKNEENTEKTTPSTNNESAKATTASNDENAIKIETPKTQPQQEKLYTIQSGDYWYKMVEENYNTASPKEIMQIVRKFKHEYFKNNEQKLRSKGYTSEKAGFMLKVGEQIALPINIVIDGKTISLK